MRAETKRHREIEDGKKSLCSDEEEIGKTEKSSVSPMVNVDNTLNVLYAKWREVNEQNDRLSDSGPSPMPKPK